MPFILDIRPEGFGLFGQVRRQWPKLLKEQLRETAITWHRDLFPNHFFGSARARYQYQPRTRVYLDVIKPRVLKQGQSRDVDLVFSGKSRRFMLSFFTVTGTSNRQTVQMRPPGYFTNPFIGSYRDRLGRMRQITRQPDKPSEATESDSADRSFLQSRCERGLVRRLKQLFP